MIGLALATISLVRAATPSPGEPVATETPGAVLQILASPRSTESVRDTTKGEEAKWTEKLNAYSALVGAIVGGIAAVAAAISAYFSLRTVRQADATERERARSAKAERFSALWSEISEWKFLNKQELGDLANPVVAETVRRNINSMGKVGFWWETNLIDREIVAQEIAQTYVSLFDQISRVGQLVTLKRSGQDLIQENPSARKLYKELKDYLAKVPQPSNPDPATTNPTTSDHET